MDKYIRTKEGNIYQRFFKDKSIRGVGGGGCCDKNLNPIGETIIKESDTIEELCDVFVIKEPDGTYRTMPLKLPCGVCENETLYGHIWVNDNLIKVAKMNEKGKLELL